MKNKQLKSKAVILRKKGYSLKEISEIVKIAKSTASLWLRNIEIDMRASNRLIEKEKAGRRRAMATIQERKELFLRMITKKNTRLLGAINNNKFNKLACALLYWCEGEKTKVC